MVVPKDRRELWVAVLAGVLGLSVLANLGLGWAVLDNALALDDCRTSARDLEKHRDVLDAVLQRSVSKAQVPPELEKEAVFQFDRNGRYVGSWSGGSQSKGFYPSADDASTHWPK